MMMFYAFAGLILGLIYSAGTSSATVWLVQVALQSRLRFVLAVAVVLAASQLPWVLIAAQLTLNSVEPYYALDRYARLVIGGILLYLAWRLRSALPIENLRWALPTGSLLRETFKRSFWMPWRLFVWIALIYAIGIHLRAPGPIVAAGLAVGASVGIFGWMSFFAVLVRLFGQRVPE